MDDAPLAAALAGQDDLKHAFRELVRIAPVGICLTDRNRRFVLVNPAYCATYGYSEAELIGQPFTAVLPEEDRDFAGQVHDAFLDGLTEESAGRWRVRRKDGEIRTVLVGAARLVAASGKAFKLTTVQDITEEDRKAVAKLEAEHAKLLAQVTAVAGHDLSNALSGLLLDIEVLREKLAPLPVDQSDILRTVDDLLAGIERARAIVHRLRIIANPPERRRMLVDPFVELGRLRIAFAERCTITDETEGFLRLEVDPWRFNEAVAALVENAVAAQAATDPSLPILVRLRLCAEKEVREVGLEPRDSPTGFLAIDVVDNGPGLDETARRAALSGLLAVRPLNAVQKIHGYGLMAAQSFARAHGGAFVLHSRPGAGTRATLILPVRRIDQRWSR